MPDKEIKPLQVFSRDPQEISSSGPGASESRVINMINIEIELLEAKAKDIQEHPGSYNDATMAAVITSRIKSTLVNILKTCVDDRARAEEHLKANDQAAPFHEHATDHEQDCESLQSGYCTECEKTVCDHQAHIDAYQSYTEEDNNAFFEIDDFKKKAAEIMKQALKARDEYVFNKSVKALRKALDLEEE